MTKHYFISFHAFKSDKIPVNGHTVMTAHNSTLKDICNYIETENNLQKDSVVIICLRELDKAEWKMLTNNGK